MNPPGSPPAQFIESLGPQFTQNSQYHVNLGQQVIVTTEDKLRLCLLSYARRLGDKEKWIAPASLFVTLLIVFPTTTFQKFVLPAETWQAVFVLGTVAAAVWCLVSITRALRANVRLDDLVTEIKAQAQSSPNEKP